MTMVDKLRAALAAALVFALICCGMVSAEVPADAAPEQDAGALDESALYGEALLLMDADTGEVLYSQNARVRMYPASTTKIMTLLLALESEIDLDETVTVPAEAGKIPSGSSVIPVKPGDKLTFRDLLYGFMLNSGNDGANAIAVLVDGSIPAFVERMNARATQLGCEGTHFVNAHGYHDSEHYTTAADLAKITLEAMKNDTFRAIVAAPSWKVTLKRDGKTGSREIPSRVLMVRESEKFYYPDCTGVKTGFHSKAGYCFVGTASRNGIHLLCVTLNCPKEDQKWYDAARLFEYGFSRYAPYTMDALLRRAVGNDISVLIANASKDDPSSGRLTLSLSDMLNGDATRMLIVDSSTSMQGAIEEIRTGMNVEWTRELVAPVRAGEVLATLRYDMADGRAVTANLVADRDVEERVVETPTPTATVAPVIPPVERDNPPRTLPGWMPVALVSAAAAILALVILIRVEEKRRRERLRRQRLARRKRRQSHTGERGQTRTDARRVSENAVRRKRSATRHP